MEIFTMPAAKLTAAGAIRCGGAVAHVETI